MNKVTNKERKLRKIMQKLKEFELLNITERVLDHKL